MPFTAQQHLLLASSSRRTRSSERDAFLVGRPITSIHRVRHLPLDLSPR
jgi:hypothetical protein